jgi:DNA replication licensing factor MCM5
VAQHVLNIHINRAVTDGPEGEIPIDKMRSYIRFAKSRIAPRLNDEAAEQLSSHFVEIRKQVHQVEQDANERSSIPITIRQLEAIIRVSESLAKMTLSPVVTREHVNEAVRLFSASTMDAVNNGGATVRKDMNDQVAGIEEEIKKRIPVGFSANYRGLVEHFVNQKGLPERALERAIWVLERKEVLQVRNQRQKIYRIGV